MSESNKRIRTGDEEKEPAVSSTIPKLYQLSLLACDPKEIAALGRHDEEMLTKLKAFKSELGSELDKVEKARQTDEAIKMRDIMQQRLGANGCLGCKSMECNNLKFCAELNKTPQHWYSIDNISVRALKHCGEDSILCQSCYSKKEDELKICKKCNQFLCVKCEPKECGGNRGGGCGVYYCESCYWECHDVSFECECENWLCPSCVERGTRRRICPACDQVDVVCTICDEEKEYCDECNDEFEGEERGWTRREHSEDSDY